MDIKINGEIREASDGITLAALLDDLDIPPRNLAIEHNGEFVDDGADLTAIVVQSGDTLEIVRFVGGG